MANVIIHENADGLAAITRPSKEWTGTLDELATKLKLSSYEIIDESKIPSDRTFRNAWVKGSGVVTEDVTKSKAIAHGTRREKRAAEFKPHDEIISLNIPGQDATAAETERVKIRTKYETMQTNIDNATDIAGIKTALGG
tara:strand:- start:581 stop:1000 length:420 start_codon:yes stop_codon:yes gene_type:complete